MAGDKLPPQECLAGVREMILATSDNRSRWGLPTFLVIYDYVFAVVCSAGLTPLQTVELNGLSSKLRDLERRFEQLVASKRSEEDRQRQLVELQKQVEMIHQRETKLTQAFRAAQQQQSLETSRIQRLTLRHRDVRTADDNDYKGNIIINDRC